MRKRNLNCLFDNIFWYIVYLLPVFALLILACKNGSFALSNLSELGFAFPGNNVILSSLSALFGSDGVLPLFYDVGFLYLMTYYVSAFIVHLAVDFLLFIPRLAHKFMSFLTRSDD